jgi:hypothetical protein
VGKKSLKVTVHGLSDENYAEVAPDSDISILGASPETFEGSSNKEIKGK